MYVCMFVRLHVFNYWQLHFAINTDMVINVVCNCNRNRHSNKENRIEFQQDTNEAKPTTPTTPAEKKTQYYINKAQELLLLCY